MAVPEHALTVDLFRHRPSLLLRLLRASGVDVPSPAHLEIVESTFPVSVADLHPDLIAVTRTLDRTSLGVLLEVQRAIDVDKPYRWPLYQALAQDRHRCDVVLLVVTYDQAVARWAAQTRPFGPRGAYAPIVVGPAEVPFVREDDPDWSPELAILSLLAHAPRPPDEPSLRTARRALSQWDVERAGRYLDLLCAELGEALLRAVEDLMVDGQPLSDYFKKQYRQARDEGLAEGTAKGLAEGTAKGLAEGTAKGLAEGTAKGLAEGTAKGLAEALVGVLSSRGLALSDAERALVLGCRDVERLQQWLSRAVTASCVADVLANRS